MSARQVGLACSLIEVAVNRNLLALANVAKKDYLAIAWDGFSMPDKFLNGLILVVATIGVGTSHLVRIVFFSSPIVSITMSSTVSCVANVAVEIILN